MPRIALHPAPAQEEQKILAVAAALEFFNSLLARSAHGQGDRPHGPGHIP